MENKAFLNNSPGRLVKTVKNSWAFVPNPLPPNFVVEGDLLRLLSEADIAVGMLAGSAKRLPNPHLLIRPYMRKEAVLSSRIEGTQATLSEVFKAEVSDDRQSDDVKEVVRYVDALELGLRKLGENFPVSLRLIRDLHRVLMDGVRGGNASPGEFRIGQNHIGPIGRPISEATYVPPPPVEMNECLFAFEAYLHRRPWSLPTLIEMGLLHYQFEAIHPFNDGNGRIGRLLVTLFLVWKKVLPGPLIYLSGYFEKNRHEYYRRLLAVSTEGAWEDWLKYFLEGVKEQAADALANADAVLALKEEMEHAIKLKRFSQSTAMLLDHLFEQPFVTATKASELLKVTFVTAQRAVENLVSIGVLEEVSGREKGRIYRFTRLLKLLS